MAGFYDFERENFNKFIQKLILIDIYRYFYPNIKKSTYWSNFLKQPKTNLNGWRIDYFICNDQIINLINNIYILDHIHYSDHCPLYIDININIDTL